MLAREFTEEQDMFRDAYRKFLAAEIVPNMERWREQGIVDREAFLKAGEQVAFDAGRDTSRSPDNEGDFHTAVVQVAFLASQMAV